MKLPLQAVRSLCQSKTKRIIPDISPYFYINDKNFFSIAFGQMNIRLF